MEHEDLRILTYKFAQKNLKLIKGIRDAGSTADFRILFEILKFGKFGKFGKF